MTGERKKNQHSKSEQGIHNHLAKRLFTLEEAAEYMGRSVWAMRELIWAGEIAIVRHEGGRKIFLDITDIEDFISRNKSKYL